MTFDADVIVVGAGPVGAALAGELGRWGARVIVIEATDGRFDDPRMHAINIRSMELMRRWGLTDRLRNCGWPQDHPQDVVFLTSLSGYQLGRIPWPSIGNSQPPVCSPTFAQRCPQSWFNPIMHAFAESQPGVRIVWRHRVTAIGARDAGVTVTIAPDETGVGRDLVSRYVVGCDGARSNVRRMLGIGRDMSGIYGQSAEALLHSPDIAALCRPIASGRYTMIDRDGISASLLPYDGHDLFRMTLMAEAQDVTPERMHAAILACAGRPVAYRLLTPVLGWTNREAIAQSFRLGRVFLAGDAAHTMPPTGGFGYNTGVLDALDLGWKLGAVLAGWGGPHLLDSYTIERRGAAVRMAAMAGAIYRDWFGVRPAILDVANLLESESAEASMARSHLGDLLVKTFRREFNSIGGAMGYSYSDSPVVIDDGSAAPPDTLDVYRPVARPGHLAPHVWIERNRSTKDLFDRSFTLIVSGGASLLLAGGRHRFARGIPLEVFASDDPALLAAYGAGLTLVRPDGHVSWRGKEASDLPSVLARSAGWGSP
jgi:2-polyprenyl-6-methoxyphenol hydroxylase-like FAD-dependent oxidoreductase